MMALEPVSVSGLIQVGRTNARDPNLPDVYVSYDADFAAQASYVVDFGTVNQMQTFGTVRGLFCDNGSNPQPIEVFVTITNQFFTVPAFAQGYFKLDASINSSVTFASDGGATDKVTITLYNYDVAPNVWYSFGPFNSNLPIQTQGSMDEGDTVATEDYNKPLYIGGIDRATGEFRGVAVDADGKLDFSSSITIGAVTIADGADVAQGDTGDAAVTDFTASATLVAIGKGLLKQSAAPTSGSITSVASSIADTVILAANPDRKGGLIVNNSNEVLNLAFANVDATLSYSFALAAGGFVSLDTNDYTGVIKGAWVAVNGNAIVTEYT